MKNISKRSCPGCAPRDRGAAHRRGSSAADAEAEFLTNDHFEAWYQDICGQLKQYED
ncbi:MAG: hypothetical protein ACLTHC_03130 [Faecalibacterium sp.]